ncbi:recombinase family protein [Ensifer adhaerens]|uniref:recombinase family protein n=1 Tax=Ensifer adhaerens TaxID=106592 RepID=UPI001CC0AB2F|nr:recombinase family protein [Ensifer adhaerens]MBZ7923143.1 recombinase family protein [Ensifer adhaerens]UAX94730.1 recombinase family protein [Ensifer adhaerens]UAY02368.1 recombinase family protein [Ensifer adhaerens]UAY09748.1 recombinase family protein [Ensifer adhaerens]
MQRRRAAIYARFSTDLQSERSVDDQIELCREFATRQGYIVARSYFDKARSGASIFGRDGLLSLMDDAREGKFDVVVVEALDRLSRDQEDLAGLHKRLTFAGVEIVAVHDGTADAIQVGIRGLVSTLFLADLKNKIRRGMTGVIRDGRHAGGRAYGYRPTPGQPGMLQIFEPEAEIVRRIFAETLGGSLPREIAADLNRDGISPPRGLNWNASTISGSAQRGNGIIRNPLYCGRIVWNRIRMVRDPETGKRVSRPNDSSEHRAADAPHLAIVDVITYEEALATLEGRAKKAQGGQDTRRPKRLLSGLLRCAHCGGGMSMHDRSGDIIRIRCSRSKESGTCANQRRYNLNKIEAAVISGLTDQLLHPELLAEYVRVYHEERRDEVAKAARERTSNERRLADLHGQLERLMQALARGILPIEAVEGQYKPLQNERDRVAAELALIPSAPVLELHPHAANQYRKAVENLAARLNELDPKADAGALAEFRSLVDSVIVHDRKDGGVEVEVIGHLSALVGAKAELLGGRMVAEEGFEPPTQGL